MFLKMRPFDYNLKTQFFYVFKPLSISLTIHFKKFVWNYNFEITMPTTPVCIPFCYTDRLLPFIKETMAKQENKRTAKDSWHRSHIDWLWRIHIRWAKSLARVPFSVIILAHQLGNCSSQSRPPLIFSICFYFIKCIFVIWGHWQLFLIIWEDIVTIESLRTLSIEW
jgi:hypothetical protein